MTDSDVPAYGSIADIPFLQARLRGTKPALVHGAARMTYAELDDRCRRFAAYLRGRVAPGARVGILLPNVPEFAVAYFGAIAAGAVAVPINLRLAPPEVGVVVADCGAEVMVTARAQRDLLLAREPDAMRSVSEWLLVDADFPDALAGEPAPEPVAVRPDDVAVLLYTSGTTGRAKGAMLSHANTLFNARSCRLVLGYREDDVGLLSVPLFHVTGLNSQLVAYLAVGATCVLQQEYDTARMLALAVEHRVTALFFVPAIFKLITMRGEEARPALAAARCAAYGGAPMDPETVRALQRMAPRMELHNCYGLTESSSLATAQYADEALAHVESVGRPVPGVEAEVRAPDGRVLPPGEAGELYLRGPNVVRGYWQAPEKTVETLRDGWLRTGDLARIDAEGFVTILDRVKDMINRGGEKIYGLEVENVLYSFPGVAEAAVVGIPHPVFGEVPVALVVPFPGVALDPEAIRKYCGARLASYKVPAEVRFLEKLPRNPGGKVLKRDLKRAWSEGPGEKAR